MPKALPAPAPARLDEELFALLEAAGATVTFSAWCITGLVGDLCVCRRCCEEKSLVYDAPRAERECDLARRAQGIGFRLGAASRPGTRP